MNFVISLHLKLPYPRVYPGTFLYVATRGKVTQKGIGAEEYNNHGYINRTLLIIYPTSLTSSTYEFLPPLPNFPKSGKGYKHKDMPHHDHFLENTNL